jgi:hypothetical protein
MAVSVSLRIAENISSTLSDLQKTTPRFVRGALVRHGNRFYKRFIKENLMGRPGIQYGAVGQSTSFVKGRSGVFKTSGLKSSIGKSLGGNIYISVTGSDVRNLVLTSRLSRFLGYHEFGTNRVPARLKFRATWDEMLPKGVDDIQKAIANAIKVAQRRGVSRLFSLAKVA